MPDFTRLISKIYRCLLPYLPFIIFAAVTAILFGNTLFPAKGRIIFGGDIYDAYFYWKKFLSDSIRSGIIPFWNPYNFAGTPFLAHPDINIFYPPNWLFIFLPENLSFSFYFYFHILIAALTMYWLIRQYSDKWGALAGAFTFSLSGYFAARILSGHLEYVDTASWLPLALGLMIKAFNFPSFKKVIAAAGGLFLLLLSGNELFFLFTLELTGLYFLFIVLRNLKKQEPTVKVISLLKVPVITVIIAAGTAAFEFLPRLEFIKLSLRSSGVSYDLAASGSLQPFLLRLFIQPFYLGTPYTYAGPWPNLQEYFYYVGIIPLILIPLFLIIFFLSKLNNKRRTSGLTVDFWFFIAVIPVFLLISLGNTIHPSIHEFLWKFTPVYRSLRFPVRHMYVVVLAISAVTGIIIGKINNRLVKLTLICLILLDLLSVDKYFFRTTEIPSSTFDRKLISLLKNDHDIYRILPDFPVVSAVRRDLDFGAAATEKIPSTSDYNSMVLSDYYHFIDILNKSPAPSVDRYNVEIPPPNPLSPLIDFLNVKYLLVDKSFNLLGSNVSDDFDQIREGDNYLLFQNKSWSPRFTLVYNSLSFPSENLLEKELLDRPEDLADNVLLLSEESNPYEGKVRNCRADTNNSADIKKYSDNYIQLEVNTNCNSFLTSSEVYYPGWRAKIDGSDTKILRSNSAFRTIYIPKGRHTVLFYYQPDIYIIGAIISSITLLLTVIITRKRDTGKLIGF